jgi:hypothetical protein
MKINLTETYIKRIKEELNQCEIRLSKQLSYAEDLRNNKLIRDINFNITQLKELLTKKSIIV